MRTIKLRLIKDGKIVGYEKHDFYQGPAQVCIMHSKDGNSWKNVAVGWGDAWIDHDHKDQYTGLKDKNDAEIYEEDVVKQLGIKYYVNMSLGIWWGTRLKGSGQFELYLLLDVEFTAEIIGNNHENPELMGIKSTDEAPKKGHHNG